MGKKTDNHLEIGKCPVRNVLHRFGDKWSILVILTLNDEGIMRFNQLQKAIGDVSQKSLTSTLRTLEADGYVSREIFPVVPPKVEYQLTPLGNGLVPHFQDLNGWAKENFSKILKSRNRYATQNAY